MGLMDLLKESQDRAPKMRKSDDGPKLHIIDMSRKGYTNSNSGEYIPSNQGSVKFLPIVDLSGREIKYAYDVKLYNYEGEEYTSYFRMMEVNDYEKNLSDEEKALILKMRSLTEHFEEVVGGFPNVDTKSYALMFGYILEHVSNDDNATITGKENRKAALLVFPSKNMSKAVTACIQDMNQMGEELANEMYNDLFSREKERTTYLNITFQKSTSSFGYDCQVLAKPVDRYCMNFLTPEEVKAQKVLIPDEAIQFCNYISATFFANNRETDDDFDKEYAEKVCAQMEQIITSVEKAQKKSEKLPPLPNKNKEKTSDLDD